VCCWDDLPAIGSGEPGRLDRVRHRPDQEACHGQSHPAWPRDKEDGIHGIQDPKLSLDERKRRNPPKQTNRFVIPPISARIPRYVIDHLYVNCMINIYVNISSLPYFNERIEY